MELYFTADNLQVLLKNINRVTKVNDFLDVIIRKQVTVWRKGTYVYNCTFCQYKLSLFFFIRNSV